MTTTDVRSSTFAVEITVVTEIDAPAEVVWAALADTARYPEWNPLVRRFDGRIAVGERVAVELQLPGRKAQPIRPRIVAVDEGRSFAWLGQIGVRGLLDGRHEFLVEPLGADRTRFVHAERLSGLLVPAFRTMLTQTTPAAFAATNEALAARVRETRRA